jgi:hypothetical protein
MLNSKKNKARGRAGSNVAGREAKATGQNKTFNCSTNHISKLVRELHENQVGLRSTSANIQGPTLLRALQYLGARGLNTYEGTAAGYARLATRIQDLEADGWVIASERENVIGPDRLFHRGIARYVLVGRVADMVNPQSAARSGVVGMSADLIRASFATCIAMLDAVVTLQEEMNAAGIDGSHLGDIQAGLVDAYHALTTRLSLQTWEDAQQLARDTITSRIEASSVVSRAVTEGK